MMQIVIIMMMPIANDANGKLTYTAATDVNDNDDVCDVDDCEVNGPGDDGDDDDDDDDIDVDDDVDDDCHDELP